MTNTPDGPWAKNIEYRLVATAKGDRFKVPQFIVRLDEPSFAGWQLRYGEWTDYPDRSSGQAGAAAALEAAMAEMIFRMNTLGK